MKPALLWRVGSASQYTSGQPKNLAANQTVANSIPLEKPEDMTICMFDHQAKLSNRAKDWPLLNTTISITTISISITINMTRSSSSVCFVFLKRKKWEEEEEEEEGGGGGGEEEEEEEEVEEGQKKKKKKKEKKKEEEEEKKKKEKGDLCHQHYHLTPPAPPHTISTIIRSKSQGFDLTSNFRYFTG